MFILFGFRYLNIINYQLFFFKFFNLFFFIKRTSQSNYFLNEKYLDPKKLFRDPIKAPNNQAIL